DHNLEGPRSMKPRRSFLRDDSGAAAVEFAIVSTAFLSLVLGISYLGIMLFTNLSMHWAVEKAVRLAMLNPSVSLATLSAEVNNYLASVGLPTATVSYSIAQQGTIPTGHVSATMAQTYVVPLIGTFNLTYVADAYIAQDS